MIIAIPEVKPVITEDGIKDTSFPSFKNDAIINITPDKNPAIKMPCNPNFATTAINIAVIAPVGPEI